MKTAKSKFLLALLSVSLPLALVGCIRSSPDTEANSKPTPPPVVISEATPTPVTSTNATQGMTPGTPSTPNGAQVPSDNSKLNVNTTTDSSQNIPAPDQSSKTNTASPDASQTQAAPNQSTKPNTP